MPGRPASHSVVESLESLVVLSQVTITREGWQSSTSVIVIVIVIVTSPADRKVATQRTSDRKNI